MEQKNASSGFTLIEVVIAMFVLAVGILALNSMQVTSIKGNASANRITSKTNMGADRIEQIIALEYDDSGLDDIDLDGTDQDINLDGIDDDAGNYGLDDAECCQDGNDPSGNAVAGCVAKADGCLLGGTYSLYWNIAEDYPILNTKTVKVIVKGNSIDLNKKVEVEYIKYDSI